MSPLAEFDLKLEHMIRELTLRIVVPRWTEFDTVWEAAIRVCDRYELGKTRRPILGTDQSGPEATKPITSSPKPSATDAPAQTHPPIAA